MTKLEYLNLLETTSASGLFPSRDDQHATCRYRDSRGRKCAVGLLIPDEKYDSTIEAKHAGAAYEMCPFDLPEGVTIDQLMLVQDAHDLHARLMDDGSSWNHNGFMDNVKIQLGVTG